jgi:hypothetical protein
MHTTSATSSGVSDPSDGVKTMETLEQKASHRFADPARSRDYQRRLACKIPIRECKVFRSIYCA